MTQHEAGPALDAMVATKVYQNYDYGQGYSERLFGVTIGDRYFPVGADGHGHTDGEAAKQHWLADEMVRRWNAALQAAATKGVENG